MSKTPTRESLKEFLRKYISPATIDATFAGVFDISRGYKVYAKPDMPNAATYFDEKLKKHIIMIGTDFTQYTGTETYEGKKSLVKSLLIHELGHTKFTHVDNKSLNDRLKKNGVPFSLFNLAEDARIEYLIKEEAYKKSGLNLTFDWTRWFATPEITVNSNPETVLFSLINTEGRERGNALVSIRAAEYYEQFLKAKNSFEVVDILGEWVNEFRQNLDIDKLQEVAQRVQQLMNAIQERFAEMTGGESSPQTNSPDSGKNQIDPQLRSFGDIGEPIDMDGEGTGIGEALDNAMSLEEASKHGSDSTLNFKPDVKAETVTVKEASSTTEIFDENMDNGEFYPHEVKKIQKALEKLKTDEKRKTPTRRATDRFNSGRMFGVKTDPAGSKIYKKDRVVNKKLNKKNIIFILDLSGSMGGEPIKNARTLMLGVNRIAKQYKNLNITILGSKINSDFQYQTIHLPANENALLSAEANGSSEGIGYALEHSQQEVKKNDIIVFFTDGHIRDREISKQYIYKFLKPTALSVGIYVDTKNEEYYNENMKNWFDELIVKDNIVDIVERIVEIANSDKYVYKNFNHLHKSDETDEDIGSSVSMK